MTNIAMRPAVRGLRLAVVLALAMSAGACSTMASLDPTGLLSDDTGSTGSSGTTPDLSTLPDKPKVATTPDDQKQVTDSLAAAGTQTQYSADALRAGTEMPAPPPPPASAVPAAAAEPVTPPPAQTASAAPNPPPAAAPPSAAPEEEAPPAPAAEAAPSAALPPPTKTAVLPPPRASRPQPAVPPDSRPNAPVTMAMISPSDAQLGFKPSTAAPLDPSINRWVSAPIVAHYRRAASGAGIAAGAQVADTGAMAPGSYSGAAPIAQIYFRGDGTTLDAAARAQIRRAVQAYNANGGQGSVRIVGHASGRTAGKTSEKHLMQVFRKSQARANAVAREVIREGVPAKKVLVDAVGDSQPTSYGPTPKGDVGSHRADIFLQG
jgi:outer membrane protein OmpA-like peptidoglycan-associated protein